MDHLLHNIMSFLNMLNQNTCTMTFMKGARAGVVIGHD